MEEQRIKDLEKKVSFLEKKLALYEDNDLEKEGYYSLKSYVKQQIDVVKKFKLDEEISKNPKDDKFYDRVKAIGEGLKTMLLDLKALKIELRITQSDEEKESKSYLRTTPESVANVLGNTAGQQD